MSGVLHGLVGVVEMLNEVLIVLEREAHAQEDAFGLVVGV